DYADVGDGRKAQMIVKGDFVQSAAGSMSIIVNDNNRTTNPTGGAQIPLVISGPAAFNGELTVDSQFLSTGTSSLSAGATFHLVQAGSITSRFTKFTGSSIDHRDDIFFGLSYGTTILNGGQAGGIVNELSLITLQTPRRITPGV